MLLGATSSIAGSRGGDAMINSCLGRRIATISNNGIRIHGRGVSTAIDHRVKAYWVRRSLDSSPADLIERHGCSGLCAASRQQGPQSLILRKSPGKTDAEMFADSDAASLKDRPGLGKIVRSKSHMLVLEAFRRNA